MLILKRLGVWLLEALVGVFLLGGLFGALSSPNLSTLISLLPGVWALAFGVGSILFLHGYYLTTALFGVVWRSQRSWLYPAIAATLFVTHAYIVFLRLKPDISSSGRAAEFPFLAGGACIVFSCALCRELVATKVGTSRGQAAINQHLVSRLPGGDALRVYFWSEERQFALESSDWLFDRSRIRDVQRSGSFTRTSCPATILRIWPIRSSSNLS